MREITRHKVNGLNEAIQICALDAPGEATPWLSATDGAKRFGLMNRTARVGFFQSDREVPPVAETLEAHRERRM